MNCEEEQRNEVEALESIYDTDLEVLSTDPLYKFRVLVQSESCALEGVGLRCHIEVEYTPSYPEEAPLLQVQDLEGLEDSEQQGEEEQQLAEHLEQLASENLGMVMVFTLVSATQEWLSARWDTLQLLKEEEEAKRKQAEEEAEMRRFEGTRVTVESFLTWKRQFDSEREAQLRQQRAERETGKLTGKELFLRDRTLNESDLKFLEDGDDVKVDESLFEDLDDLDLEDEDEEVTS